MCISHMKRSAHYCKSWFRFKKRAIEIWTDDRAARAHEFRQPYTVLIDSPEAPACFLEFAEYSVAVGFLDAHLREYLVYAFQHIDQGRLFLSMITHREFQGDTDKVARGESHIFNPNGQVHTRRAFYDPYRLEQSNTVTDVSGNYSDWPEFGEYEDLIRLDRSAEEHT
jgi:hypothetical protein